jgi:hypothetical protein
MFSSYNRDARPPYLLGLLGFVPLVGAFVGVALILYGLIKYHDRKLVLIGVACVLFTVFAYASLGIFSRSEDFQKRFVSISKDELNGLVKNVEFYKVQHGQYPDSLEELTKEDKMIFIYDPVQKIHSKQPNFRYKKSGDNYYLFSAGVDGMDNTSDDIYPVPPVMKTGKTGLLIPGK